MSLYSLKSELDRLAAAFPKPTRVYQGFYFDEANNHPTIALTIATGDAMAEDMTGPTGPTIRSLLVRVTDPLLVADKDGESKFYDKYLNKIKAAMEGQGWDYQGHNLFTDQDNQIQYGLSLQFNKAVM